MFIEEWLAAKGKSVVTDQMVPWRRQHMSSLVNAFDFANPDYSLPSLPDAPAPHTDPNGAYDGAAYCESLYSVTRPTVPYSSQIAADKVSVLSESGFKPMRGSLTEGRYIVLELAGYALANPGNSTTGLAASKAVGSHNDIRQRWIVHSQVEGGNKFTISSAVDARYLAPDSGLVSDVNQAGDFIITFKTSEGYSLQNEDGNYVSIGSSGSVLLTDQATYFKAFSVTYPS
jgi:phospholipase C